MNSNHSLIRHYEASDRAACMAAFISNVPKYFTQEEVHDFESFLARLEERHIATQFFVLIQNSNIIACGGFGDKEGTGDLSLAWGLVHRSYHKKGHGAELLEFRLKAIKEQHPDKKLVVDTTQYSFGFFEKFGFRTTKITKDYYAPGLDRYDMIWQSAHHV